MPSNITLAKGAYTVTVYTDSVTDGIKNQLVVLPTPTVSQVQDSGPAGTKIADLLRLTRTFLIKGYIESNSVKSDLMKIAKGADIKGGVVTLTYSEGGDLTTFSGYIQSCLVTQESSDEPASPTSDFPKFIVTLTFIEGTRMSGA